MKLSFILIIFCFSNYAYCSEPEILTATVRQLSHGDSKWMCAQIPGFFMQELAKFESAHRRLQDLLNQGIIPENTPEILALERELKLLSERLTKLADPEWNNQATDLSLTWIAPYSYFFKYPDVVSPWGNPNHVTDYEVLNVEYMNRPFEFDPGQFMVNLGDGSLSGDRVEFKFTKRATLLELCQFIKTIDIAVSVTYDFQLGKKKYPLTETFRLMYGDWDR